MSEKEPIGIVGAGWVGLVTAACFAELGHRVVVREIVPEKVESLERGEVPFHEVDLRDREAVEKVLAHGFDAVIHFAGLKAVGESIRRVAEDEAEALLTALEVANRIRAHQLAAVGDPDLGDVALRERGLAVDYRSVWEFVHAEQLSYKKRRWSRPSRAVPMSRAAAGNG